MMIITYTGIKTETVMSICEPCVVLVQLPRSTNDTFVPSAQGVPERSAIWKFPFHSGIFPNRNDGEYVVNWPEIRNPPTRLRHKQSIYS